MHHTKNFIIIIHIDSKTFADGTTANISYDNIIKFFEKLEFNATA